MGGVRIGLVKGTSSIEMGNQAILMLIVGDQSQSKSLSHGDKCLYVSEREISTWRASLNVDFLSPPILKPSR